MRSMRTHVVVGAGGIGQGIARQLAARGDRVVLASRSGSAAAPEGVRTAAVDAGDPAALVDLCQGADTLVNAVNPPKYTTWERDWPPVAAAMLAAAEKTGAGLVTVSNLYGYGEVAGPMTEDTPLASTGKKGRLRARMWQDALAAHEAGRIRATELRASDYFGGDARARTSVLNEFVLGPAARGRTVRLVMGDPDAPHSWTYLPDIAALAATLATDDRSWGRPWHVPTAPARSVQEVVADLADATGRPAPAVRLLPAAVRGLLRVVPVVRELDETRHQFERPFVLDSSAAERTFGLAPTPWQQALVETAEALRSR
jgi:nucleoside-diphosphate-sugar epimerase